MDDSLEWFVDDVLTHVGVCRPEKKGMASLTAFDGALVLPGFTTVSDFGSNLHIRMKQHPKHVWSNMNVSIVQVLKSGDDPTGPFRSSQDDEDSMSRYAIRKLQPLPARMRPSVRAPRHFTALLESCMFNKDGTYFTGNTPFGWNGDGWDYLSDSRPDSERDVQEHGKKICGVLVGIAIAKLAWWTVSFALDGSQSVSIPTDPAGARATFAMRDLAPGRKRRDALRHWVREHGRMTSRNDRADETWVRAHLRGTTDFTWNGLRCQIRPSQVDELLNRKDLPAASRIVLEESRSTFLGNRVTPV